MRKPTEVFDRDHEWAALTAFVADERPGATLGVVSGRRRQGKSFLLDALCESTGGFYFGATEATDTESLTRISIAVSERLGGSLPLRPRDWHEVFDLLLALGADTPIPVIIDEFPYLARAQPALPSIVQEALRPSRERVRTSRTRFILCGSALSFMGGLLAGGAPLRGRAGLDLVVPTLDHRLAARFWGIRDPGLALRVNAIVGGTPAYRREYARDDVPRDRDDFDAWVQRTVLSPSSPLFREARYLLAEEPGTRDLALYHAVLGAVATGSTTRGGIASAIGRQATDISHPITVLEDAGLLVREPDALRANRSQYRIAEPLITFYHSVMRPAWPQLERPGAAERVWSASRARFTSQVLGPRFEQICRSWTQHDAGPRLADIAALQVGAAVVNDPQRRTTHQLDVVALGPTDGATRRVLALGEAKVGEVMSVTHLDRLRHVVQLLEHAGRYDVRDAALVCFSGAGFTPELRRAARASAAAGTSGRVELVSLHDLYRA